MKSVRQRFTLFCALISAPALAACGAGVQSQPVRALPPVEAATDADVAFLTGMIHHHAQALVMAGWSPTHGASEQIQILSERIIVSQRDEIALIELWLRDHGIEPPELAPMVATGSGGGMVHDHEMLMPGMLTREEMARLDGARGEAFDRLFLEYMIKHHEGALTMVDTLFASHGGAVDDAVYKFASDTFADQGSEIDRMARMLEAMSGSPQ